MVPGLYSLAHAVLFVDSIEKRHRSEDDTKEQSIVSSTIQYSTPG